VPGLGHDELERAIFLLDHLPGPARSATMPWALRSVMPRLAAMSQPRAGVVCDAHQHPGVAGQETPVRHDQTVYHLF
jgi:hypothetical protein